MLATAGLASAKPEFVARLIQRSYVASGGSMASFAKAAEKLKSVTVI